MYVNNKVLKREKIKNNKLISKEITIKHVKTSLIPNFKDFKDTKIFAHILIAIRSLLTGK